MTAQENFIKDLKALFEKYDVWFCVEDKWGGPNNRPAVDDYLGRAYSILSNPRPGRKRDIYIDDFGIFHNMGIRIR